MRKSSDYFAYSLSFEYKNKGVGYELTTLKLYLRSLLGTLGSLKVSTLFKA